MTQDYAMTTLDRLLARKAGHVPATPIDPAMRARVNQLVDQLRAIGFRRQGAGA